MKAILFIIAFASLVGVARADILFIDLDLSTKEVEAARQAATARGEKLIVIPEMDKIRARAESLKAECDKLSAEVKTIQSKLNKTVEKSEFNALTVKRDAMTNLLNKRGEKLSALIQPYLLSPADISKVLSEIESRGDTLTALVLSGHHPAHYLGDAGDLGNEGDILAPFQKHPKSLASIASVYLWGCYSGTVASIALWKSGFPGLQTVVGYNDSAPSQEYTQDMTFLRSSMIREKELTEASTAKALYEKFKSLPGAQGSAAVICANDNLARNSGPASYSDETKRCPPEITGPLVGFENAYYKYDKKDVEVPADPHHSDLRDFYTELRQYSHCEEVAHATFTPENVIRLIYFQNLFENFLLKYRDAVQAMQNVASKIPALLDGKSDAEKIAFLHYHASLNEGDAREQLEQIKLLSTANAPHTRAAARRVAYISSYADEIGTPQEKEKIHLALEALGRILISDSCIPDMWIEPASRAEDLPSMEGPCHIK